MKCCNGRQKNQEINRKKTKKRQLSSNHQELSHMYRMERWSLLLQTRKDKDLMTILDQS
jgi:hypothetical protein